MQKAYTRPGTDWVTANDPVTMYSAYNGKPYTYPAHYTPAANTVNWLFEKNTVQMYDLTGVSYTVEAGKISYNLSLGRMTAFDQVVMEATIPAINKTIYKSVYADQIKEHLNENWRVVKLSYKDFNVVPYVENPAVKLAQQYFIVLNKKLDYDPYDLGTSGPNKDGVDGKWVSEGKVFKAIQRFQKEMGLPADGLLDPLTFVLLEEKAKSITAEIENYQRQEFQHQQTSDIGARYFNENVVKKLAESDDGDKRFYFDLDYVEKHKLGPKSLQDPGWPLPSGFGFQLAGSINWLLTSGEGGIEIIWFLKSDFNRDLDHLYTNTSKWIPYVFIYGAGQMGAGVANGKNVAGQASTGIIYILDALKKHSSNPRVLLKCFNQAAPVIPNGGSWLPSLSGSIFAVATNKNITDPFDYIGITDIASVTLFNKKVSGGISFGDNGVKNVITAGFGIDSNMFGATFGQANYVMVNPVIIEELLSGGIDKAFQSVVYSIKDEFEAEGDPNVAFPKQ